MSTGASKPTLHYFDLGSLGRGELVRLFFVDAGIKFNDVRYKYDPTWRGEHMKALQKKGLAIPGHLPVLEYNGLVLTQHLSILRYLARTLGKYDGETSEDKHLVDAVGDIYNDWRATWVANIGAPTDKYKNEQVPEFHQIWSHYYDQNPAGPYLLGKDISYADFAIFQALDNDRGIGAITKPIPENLLKLEEAIKARPNIASYLASERKVPT